MTTSLVPGQKEWRLVRDVEGHREYTIKHRVTSDDPLDGPATVLLTSGLPQPGVTWAVDNDVDLWAFCLPVAKIEPVTTGEPNRQWDVEQVFSSKPPPANRQRCQDVPIEDPLLEPAKVGGSFVKYTEEAIYDRFGYPITNSSHEQIRGPQNEWDRNRPTIKITQNVASAYQAYVLPTALIDHVNYSPIWGLATRCVKLSAVSWERRFYGVCNVYYERSLEFDINPETFDRLILDEGQKVLHGHWDRSTGSWILDNVGGAEPDRFNPQHFDRFKDRQGENTTVVLNGRGLPAGIRVMRSKTISLSNVYTPSTSGGWWQRRAESAVNFTDIFALQTPIILVSPAHGLQTGQEVYIAGVVADWGDQAAINGSWTVTRIDADQFSLDDSVRGPNAVNPITGSWVRWGEIENATDASPIVILSTNHGLVTGNEIIVQDVPGNTASNGVWTVTRVNDDVFSLDGSVGNGTYNEALGTSTSGEDTTPGAIKIERYPETNFLVLGIPLTF